MTNQLLMSELFTALNIAVMERMEDRTFAIVNTLPSWFLEFCAEASSLKSLTPQDQLTFLGNFLIDVEEFWTENNTQILKSGPWCEVAPLSGQEYCLEATAIKLDSRKILLVETVGSAYAEKQRLIQIGRENSLHHQELIKEIQKKEILLHCIVHDLSSPLTVIFTSLSLLELDCLEPKKRRLIEICKLQCNRQEILIREMLDTFAAEVESLENFFQTSSLAPDALHCIKEVISALLPTFSIKNINLQLEPNIDLAKDWKVVGEKSRLERIIINLVENAFRHSSEGSTVTINLQEEPEKILISVEDEGSGVPPDLYKHLFEKFSQGKSRSGKAGLGLYFCRITVERWSGKIGYLPRSEGGSIFWFSLPKPNQE
jgi:signal transduction histidine kinase